MNRRTILFLVVAAIILTRGCPVRVFNTSNDSQARLLDTHNKERKSRSLKTLKLNRGLCDYAQKHAEKMAKQNSLRHSQMSELASAAGSQTVAENIAWGQENEEEVTVAWMHSTGHRMNILGDYTDVGFGMAKNKNGEIYWCSVFCKGGKGG